jgi:hypothetical protein
MGKKYYSNYDGDDKQKWVRIAIAQKDKEAIETTAKKILEMRKRYPESCLADLYDVATMPDDLKKAHLDNDKAVMKAYGFTGKTDEEVTKAFLKLYKKLTSEK